MIYHYLLIKIEPFLAPYAGLEAMALMSSYAFSKLKLKRVDCAFTLMQKVGNKELNFWVISICLEANIKPKHILQHGVYQWKILKLMM